MPRREKTQPLFPEFIIMMALTMSLVALAIDTMLPAHAVIGQELGVANINDTQFLVYTLFIGLGFGQIIFGPLADSKGRIPALFAGLGCFLVGTAISLFSNDFPTMLAGRLLQGVGVAGPRTIAVAIVRDLYKGRKMASVMSFIMTVFILVPAIAPAIGQGIMLLSGWRSIFWAYIGLALLIALWFAFRQPETLKPAYRQPLDMRTLGSNILVVVRHPVTMGYTMAAALISGAFIGFLATAQQILQVQYALGVKFPLYFALLALCVGTSQLVNGNIVMRFGMRPLAKTAAIAISIVAALIGLAAWHWQGHPPLVVTMAGLMALLLCIGFMFGNLNALAMEPMGEIAATAAAIIGAASTLISAILGVAAGSLYNGTLFPLAGSFLVLGTLTAIVIAVTAKYTNYSG
ncbi:MAG: multidrug effflux MFS transporter [Pseudomonadota bacterium]